MFKQIEEWLAKNDEDRKPLSTRERDLLTKMREDSSIEDRHKTVEKLASLISLKRG